MNPIEDGGCWRGAAGGASDGPFASVFHPIPLASSHLSGRPFLFLFISFSFLLLFFWPSRVVVRPSRRPSFLFLFLFWFPTARLQVGPTQVDTPSRRAACTVSRSACEALDRPALRFFWPSPSSTTSRNRQRRVGRIPHFRDVTSAVRLFSFVMCQTEEVQRPIAASVRTDADRP